MSTAAMSDVPPASSSLPLPPMQYVNLYSEENLQRGHAPSSPKPMQESYSVFGVPFHTDDLIIRPLESQGIRRLYPHKYDHKQELKKLNHSILVNFLDMLDILIRCPDTSRREEKKEDISLLFIHIHHLINEFRPHQARETLRVMMEVQKRQRLETAERFQKHLDRVFEILQGSLAGLLQSDSHEMDGNEMLCANPESPEDNWGSQDDSKCETDTCSGQDRLMCDIVDAL